MKSIFELKVGQNIRWKSLDANINEDGRFFYAVSGDDGRWLATGFIVNYKKNKDSPNPTLKITAIYKKYK